MKEIISQYMSKLGKKGGKASAKSRFDTMTKKQKSDYMKMVRAGKKIDNEFTNK